MSDKELAPSLPFLDLKAAVELAEAQMVQEQVWEVKNFPIAVATSISDDTEQIINLAETLGQNSRMSKAKSSNSDNKFWLPSSFKVNDEHHRNKQVLPHFSKVAVAQGFSLRSNGWEPKRNHLRIVCKRGKLYRSNPKDPNKKAQTHRHNVTTKAVAGGEDRCPFAFNVHWDPTLNRWFLPKKQQGSSKHKGHILRTPDIAQARVTDLPEDEVKLVSDLNEAEVPLSSVDNIILSRNNITLSERQWEHLRTKQREVMDDRSLSDGVGPGPVMHPKTPADRLLAHFDANPDSKYVALFGEHSSGRLTIKKRRKQKANHSVEDVPLKDAMDSVTNAELEAAKLEESIRGSLSVSSRNGKILLAIVWTDDQSQARFDMFPEVLAIDCTNSVNKEERPMGLFCGIDANNQTFTHTWAFLPAESRWVFKWIVRSALPNLQNQQTLSNVNVILTDQDGQLNFVLDNNSGEPNTIFPNAVHRLCAWHKLDRGLTNHSKFKGVIRANENTSDSSAAEFNALVTWLWWFCRSAESSFEANLSLALLDIYLQSHPDNQQHLELHMGFLSHDLRTKLRDFVSSSFTDVSMKLFNHNFVGVRSFGKITSSIVEAENSAAKKHKYGPGPQDGIDRAQRKLAKRTDQRYREKRRATANSLESVPTDPLTRQITVQELTRHASEFLYGQHLMGNLHECKRVSDTECWVKLSEPEDPVDYSLDRDGATFTSRQATRKSWLIPKFERTRIVNLFQSPEHEGLAFATCSCGSHLVHGMACRHIYAALKVEPSKWHADFKFWKLHDATFLGDALSDELRTKISNVRSMSRNMHGVILTTQEMPTHSQGPPDEWFTNTLSSPKVKEDGFWATSVGRRMIDKATEVARASGDQIYGFGELNLSTTLNSNSSESIGLTLQQQLSPLRASVPGEGGTGSLPNNLSGRKRSNSRMKRPWDE